MAFAKRCPRFKIHGPEPLCGTSDAPTRAIRGARPAPGEGLAGTDTGPPAGLKAGQVEVDTEIARTQHSLQGAAPAIRAVREHRADDL